VALSMAQKLQRVSQSMVEDQQLLYSGHLKKHHAIAHLATALRNGSFDALFDEIPAAVVDASLCIQVQLGDRLLGCLPPTEHRFMYGDAALGSQDCVLGPYKRAGSRVLATEGVKSVTIDQQIPSGAWFRRCKSNVKFLALQTSLITGLCPISRHMPVFSFIYNYRTCMKGGNQISQCLICCRCRLKGI
jgi:hypothetical protein